MPQKHVQIRLEEEEHRRLSRWSEPYGSIQAGAKRILMAAIEAGPSIDEPRTKAEHEAVKRVLSAMRTTPEHWSVAESVLALADVGGESGRHKQADAPDLPGTVRDILSEHERAEAARLTGQGKERPRAPVREIRKK